MRDIEGIESAMKVLKPHWDDIEADFNRHNDSFLRLFNVDHEPIGRILRAHLIIENFLDEYLVNFYGIEDYEDLRLTFAQKAKLLPAKHSVGAFVRPGIIQLNSIRNKYGHRIDQKDSAHNMSAIFEVLSHARPGCNFPSDVDAVEAFAAVVCAFLSVPPKHLQEVFMQAFSHIRSINPER